MIDSASGPCFSWNLLGIADFLDAVLLGTVLQHRADATSTTRTDSVLLRAIALHCAHHTVGATEEIVSAGWPTFFVCATPTEGAPSSHASQFSPRAEPGRARLPVVPTTNQQWIRLRPPRSCPTRTSGAKAPSLFAFTARLEVVALPVRSIPIGNREVLHSRDFRL